MIRMVVERKKIEGKVVLYYWMVIYWRNRGGLKSVIF